MLNILSDKLLIADKEKIKSTMVSLSVSFINTVIVNVMNARLQPPHSRTVFIENI